MELVTQEDKTGCGIACVAMLCGSKYVDVKKIAANVFGWEMSQRSFYTNCTEMQTLLRALKIKAQKGRMIRKWESLPDTAIVAINYNEKNGNWHWVVFCRDIDGERVLDPQSKRKFRTDFNRMRLRSCISVEPILP